MNIVDCGLALCFQSVGNLAFQDFYQRTLSSSSTATARMICFIAAGVVIVLGIPPVLIGAVAASTGTPDVFFLPAKPFSCPHSGSSASISPFSLCTSFTKKKFKHYT